MSAIYTGHSHVVDTMNTMDLSTGLLDPEGAGSQDGRMAALVRRPPLAARLC
jgi:hypothetical protein